MLRDLARTTETGLIRACKHALYELCRCGVLSSYSCSRSPTDPTQPAKQAAVPITVSAGPMDSAAVENGVTVCATKTPTVTAIYTQ